jgi:tetratricopeptide (TPR) repeat protein
MLEIPASGIPESHKLNRSDEPTSQFRPFLWPGRACVIGAVLFAPWWIGSVHSYPIFLLHILSILSLLFWWLDVGFTSKRRVIVPYLAIPVILGLLFSVSQLIPMRESVATLLAPKQYEIYRQFADPVSDRQEAELSTAEITRFSIQPDKTLRMIGLLLVALNFMMASAHFFQSRFAAMVLFSCIALNGVALASVGLVQQAIGGDQILGFYLPKHKSVPFSSFVNRNNAAGYLLMTLSAATALSYLLFVQRTRGQRPRLIVTHELPFWRRAWMSLLLFISELNAKKLISLIAIAIITIGIFGTLSRGGFIAGVVGAMATFWCFGIARKPENTISLLIATMAVLFVMAIWFTVGQRLVARFGSLSDQQEVSQELRFQNWSDTAPAILDYGLFGSGLGTYESVHRIYRNDAETKIFEFAENQYFQTAVENGWLGAILLIAAIAIAWVSATFILRRGNSATTISVGLMGTFLLASQAVAAFLDFGLYIPANAILMATLCGVIVGQAHSLGSRLKKKNIYQSASRKVLVQLIVLFLFAGTVWCSLYAWRMVQLDRIVASNPARNFDYSVDQEQIDTMLAETSELIRTTEHADAYLHRARLHYHMYRLNRFPIDCIALQQKIEQYKSAINEENAFILSLNRFDLAKQSSANLLFDQLGKLVNSENGQQSLRSNVMQLVDLPASEVDQFLSQLQSAVQASQTTRSFNLLLDRIFDPNISRGELKNQHDLLISQGVDAVPAAKKFVWAMSNPLSVHSSLNQLYRENRILHDRMVAGLDLQTQFTQARRDLAFSRQRNPLNPAVHLMMVELEPAVGNPEDEKKQIERLIAAVPTNPTARSIVASLAFNSNRLEQACEQWRYFLELDQDQAQLERVLQYVRGRMDKKAIYENVIPQNNPFMMYWFVRKELTDDADKEFADSILRDAKTLSLAEDKRDFETFFLRGRIYFLLGEYDNALANFERAESRNRANRDLIFELARLHLRMNRPEKAKLLAEYLTNQDPKRRSYKILLDTATHEYEKQSQ